MHQLVIKGFSIVDARCNHEVCCFGIWSEFSFIKCALPNVVHSLELFVRYEVLIGVTTKVAVVCDWMPYDLIAMY